MKLKLASLVDTQGFVRYLNPALVTCITATGGVIKNEAVVQVTLACGTIIHATGFGDTAAAENCADQLDLTFLNS